MCVESKKVLNLKFKKYHETKEDQIVWHQCMIALKKYNAEVQKKTNLLSEISIGLFLPIKDLLIRHQLIIL